ncbi:MAG: hypothetical protein BIP78_0714 [Candidatus Bipolaricaulis sibiricus]|uniref:Phospholipid/glycerol acyltransferase domain-containing protein n=1 Tax=Bipolaricaulis sibiricus TaxID=2501609 RepID=A0A410FU89_BIPS1|nr:MAG: hypothetical protein BIP78_0714 [Candidatus Bipolaricaulis sibiricus]
MVGWPARGQLGRTLVRVIAWPPRRSEQSAATCDRIACAEGSLRRWTLSQFASGLEVEGEEHVPPSGPVPILSSHPGSVDALALVAGVGRDGLNRPAWPMPFLLNLPNVSRHLIFAADERRGRAPAVRQGIQHLPRGGALRLFPGGRPEQDPATMGRASSGPELTIGHASGLRPDLTEGCSRPTA